MGSPAHSPGRSAPARRKTAVDAVADRYLETFAMLDPCAATGFGITGHDDDITDYSPDGVAARAEAARAALSELAGVAAVDDVDRVTIAAMQERLGIAVELHDAGLDLGELNVVVSPLQSMRDVFDLMATDTDEDWALIGRRLAAVPRRADGYADGLRAAVTAGHPPAARQVSRGVEQARRIQQFFVDLVQGAPESMKADLTPRATAAAHGYARLADVLRDDIAPHAREYDPVGRDAYRLFSRAFVGAAVDLDETYYWAMGQLEEIIAEQESITQRLCPGVSVAETMRRLDDDDRYIVEGTGTLRAWMQDISDRAVESLAGTHFEIAEPLRRLECRIAPTQTGGIYYTGPSEDLTRPGRMWWSVPAGVDTFHTWQETTTVYHEGVPGHHLQIGRAVWLADKLNRWRRLGCWVSGHGEGWALYAERLMAELGYLDDPADRMGMLEAQRFRAARVVIDIGVHCGLAAPDGGVWDTDRAWAFLCTHSAQGEEKLRFELDRYLGWPGQAPSYSIGQRIWMQLRERMLAQGLSLKDFHSKALDLGSVGLDVLTTALHAD